MEASADMVFKLVLAAVLGGVVGYEREMHEHPAGLRTHILVCMGAALITLVSLSFSPEVGDPGRIAAQIVSGIGFLGAGTILRQGSIVRGLTTAASLWTVAGIGMAIAIGGAFYLLAVVATAIVFITLSTVRTIEPPIGRRTRYTVYIELPTESMQVLGGLTQRFVDSRIQVRAIGNLESPEVDKLAFELKLVTPASFGHEDILQILADQEGLDRFELT